MHGLHGAEMGAQHVSLELASYPCDGGACASGVPGNLGCCGSSFFAVVYLLKDEPCVKDVACVDAERSKQSSCFTLANLWLVF